MGLTTLRTLHGQPAACCLAVGTEVLVAGGRAFGGAELHGCFMAAWQAGQNLTFEPGGGVNRQGDALADGEALLRPALTAGSPCPPAPPGAGLRWQPSGLP